MSLCLGILLMAGLVGLLIWAWQRDRAWEYLPSAGFALLAVIPLPWIGLPASPWATAFVWWSLIFFAISLVADSVAVWIKSKAGSVPTQAVRSQSLPLWVVMLSLSLPVLHLCSMERVPLLAALGVGPPVDLQDAREAVGRGSWLPGPVHYLFNANLVFLIPIVIGSALRDRHWRLLVWYVPLCIVYALAALEKFPLVILAGQMFFLVLVLVRGPGFRVQRWSLVGCVGCVLSISLAGLWMAPRNVFTCDGPEGQAPTESGWVDTQPDRYRRWQHSDAYGSIGRFQRINNYLWYRAFLVPGEVGFRWFDFFNSDRGGKIGWSGLRLRDRSDSDWVSPARRIGLIYREQFPWRYAPYVTANAAVHADAWSRWGGVGVVAVGLLYGLLRCLVASTLFTGIFASRIVQVAVLAPLGPLLAIGSLQALLIAKGYALFGVAGLAHAWWTRRVTVAGDEVADG